MKRMGRLGVFLVIVMLALLLPCNMRAQAAAKPKALETQVELSIDYGAYKIELVNVEKGAKVKYSSSDKKVVTVKKGKVTPKGVGKATVTVKIKQNGKSYKVKVKFTVTKNENEYFDSLAKERSNKLISDVAIEKNTMLKYDESNVCKSVKDVWNRLIVGCKNSSLFHLYFEDVSDFKYLRSEEEYLSVIPDIDELKFLAPTQYANIVSLTIVTSEERGMYPDEFVVDCALTMKDTSYLEPDEKKLYNEVVALSKELKGKDEYSTVKNIHDYLVLNLAYINEPNKAGIHTLSYALENGECVCDGYAKSFYFLCRACGLECNMVVGWAYYPDGQKESHAWNKVRIDGKWYSVDVTWDDPYPDEKGRLKYYYFLVTDEDIALNHEWDDKNLPKASDKDLGIIYETYGAYDSVTGDAEALEYFKAMLEEGIEGDLPVTIGFIESSSSATLYEKLGKALSEFCNKHYCNATISYEGIGFMGTYYSVELYGFD